MHFSTLKSITEGVDIQFNKDTQIHHLVIDSRKISDPNGSLFFAIAGERHDGHRYLDELYALGVRQFVIEKTCSLENLPEANVIKVGSSIRALQQIATTHRNQFKIPVIGITGSNGKTIIKEWLYQLLSPDFSVVTNPGSYNSQVGVPLSVWNISWQHQLGIFEAGISKKGEMDALEKIIKPSIGIFTNVGPAHDEGFKSTDEKVLEKLKLFQNVEHLIYCSDHMLVDKHAEQNKLPHLSWGFTGRPDIKIEKTDRDYLVEYNGIKFNLLLPFSDKASVENAFHCVAVLLLFKVDPVVIQSRVHLLRSVAMRLEMKEGINHCQLIDDSYNNDLNGLQVSLDFLKYQNQKQSKRIILSDVLQSGLTDERLCANIATIISASDVDSFVGIGPVISKYNHLFPAGSAFYPSTEDFLSDFNPDVYQNELILIKGARVFEFEKIVNKLQRKVHGTVMEVDLNALVSNLNFFKSKLSPGTKIMVMVKALAYGSGSVEIANLLSYHKVDYLGVAYPDEGIDLRKNNITLPIMVMNPSEESFDQLLAFKLEPEMYSLKMFKSFLLHANGAKVKVHIKLDTGMVRLGFNEEDLDEVISLLSQNRNIEVASIFSHLAGADENAHDQFSNKQVDQFSKWARRISEAIGYFPLLHILNSSGILRFPQFHFDMVRLGIGLYGIDPTEMKSPLKLVAKLKTTISQIRKIKKGESVGYGRSFTTDKETVVATLAIGYADGFSRAFSNGVGEVIVNGKRAPILGRVCMDMTMIDITNIPAEEGDEVIVFGEQLPIEELAKKINTIPYEILTSTSERVKRIFVAESI